MSARSKCSMVGTMSSTASFSHPLGMIDRQAVRHPRAAVVAADQEAAMTEMLHHLDEVARHLLLGVGRVVGRGLGLERAAVAAQVGADHREALRHLRCHGVPHGVRLRVAVQQQQRRSGAAAAQAHLAAGDCHVLEREAGEEHVVLAQSVADCVT